MKNYTFLSDSDESVAIEELLSQANDLCVLEQITAINCTGFTDDSVLPSNLENRFRRLKTFPSSSKPSPSPPPPQFHCRSPSISDSSNNNLDTSVLKPESPSKGKSDTKKDPELKSKLKPRSVSSAHYSTNLPSNDSIFSPPNEIPGRKRETKSKSRSRSFSPPLSSSDYPSRSSSPSPPQKPGCFWCSPKKVPKKKSKENRIAEIIALDWDKSEEVLSSFGASSVKEQKKLLKKIAKEEEKINREAEKIVKMAKQASARMNISENSEEDEVSD